jgi:hypothetical protein
VTTVKKSLLLAVLFAACLGRAQSLKTIAVHFPAGGSIPNNIQFLCSQKYDQTGCVKDASVLRQAIAPYPLQLLGAWSFMLVPADDWKALVRGQGGDPVSPAFSMLDQRVTLLDSSLFSETAARNKELMERFGMIGQSLVGLALTHEMGHAICNEKDERRADDYGKKLRDGEIPTCGKTVDGNVELHLRPEIIEAMRNAWLSASLGNSRNEAGFYYDGTINPVALTNQNGQLSFIIPAGTTAVFHTHPQGHDPMSRQDIDVANQNNVDMYVISRSGLYHYRPGMKGPEMLQAGTDYLARNKKKGSK